MGSRDFEDEIFASAWPQEPSAPVPGPRPQPAAADAGDEIFAQAWPADLAVPPPAPEPPASAEIDQLWADFDAEVTQGLAAGRCPYCQNSLVVDLAKPMVACRLCGGAFATFHASTLEGQA
jgi:hypothetical protein